jgi:hypothetical protein
MGVAKAKCLTFLVKKEPPHSHNPVSPGGRPVVKSRLVVKPLVECMMKGQNDWNNNCH